MKSHWFKALLAAFIVGAATSGTTVLADPSSMDLAKLQRSLIVMLVAGLLGAVAYLVKSPVPDDSVPINGTLKLLVAALAILSLSTGCATNTPDAVKNARNAGLNAAGVAALKDSAKILGSIGTQVLFSEAQALATGGKANLADSAAAALWSQANSTTTAALYGDISSAFTAGKAAQLAKTVANVSSVAIAAGAKPEAVGHAMAAAISTGAGAPPAK